MKRKLIVILIVLLGSCKMNVTAQKSLVKQGDRQYEAHNFAKAANSWQKAFERTDNLQDKQYLAFRIGSAFHRMNHYEEAIQWYTDALGEEASNVDWLLAQADAYLRSGNIQSAKNTADRVLRFDPNSLEAKRIVAMLDQYNRQMKAENLIVSSAVRINSEWSDYAPAWFNGDLIISSSRKTSETASNDGRTSENYSSLYLFISNLYGDFGNAIRLPIGENTNAGAFTYDVNQQRVFFTKCNNRRKKCTIMESKIDVASLSFSKPKVAGFVDRKYHYGHPYVREDGRKMFFNARIPGGYGGNDIYSITIKPDGTWGLPVNLGSNVNTAFDEMFPTAAGDSLLFFSSTGYAGFGGLDILYTFDHDGQYDLSKALTAPFNSTSDDMSLVMKPGTVNGAFSSNRNRASGDDIYFFDAYPIQKIIYGKVLENNTLNPIADAKMQIGNDPEQRHEINSKPDGSYAISIPVYTSGVINASHPDFRSETKSFPDAIKGNEIDFKLNPRQIAVGVSGKVTERETNSLMPNETIAIQGKNSFLAMTKTNENGVYVFDSLVPEQIYTLKITKEGYFSESRVVKIPEVLKPTLLKKSNGYDLDFELTAISVKKEIELKDIYYDFDKATLRESSKIELGKLVSMLRDNPTVRVQINSHTDTRGTIAYNDRLSAERAKAVVDYLISSGISSSRLISKGFGKRNPIIKNAKTENDHQLNRRTTFQVTDLNGSIESVSSINSISTTNSVRLVYRVQILVSATKHDTDSYFEAIKQIINNITFYVQEQGQMYRYEVGDRYSLAEAEALRNQIRFAGFMDCFIVPYIDNQRVSIQQAKDFKQ